MFNQIEPLESHYVTERNNRAIEENYSACSLENKESLLSVIANLKEDLSVVKTLEAKFYIEKLIKEFEGKYDKRYFKNVIAWIEDGDTICTSKRVPLTDEEIQNPSAVIEQLKKDCLKRQMINEGIHNNNARRLNPDNKPYTSFRL